MTTHLRARWAQAGALLAVVVGGIAVAPAVALADPPKVDITSLSTDVLSGSSVTLGFHVSPANGGGGGQASADIKISGMDCQGVCSQIAQIGQDGKDFTVTLKAPTVNAGATQTVTVTVTATINGETNTKNQPVNVKGPDKPQTVTSVSGKVRDQNGKAIAGASVVMAAGSSDTSFLTTTNSSGAYSFNSTDAKPILAGTITVGAVKDGFQSAKVQVQGTAGKSVTAPLTLKAVAASASATPSATASANPSAEAAPDASTDDEATGDTAPANANTKPTSGDQSGGFGSTLFLVVGGLLVAGGIGAIVLVLMRRRNNDGSGPDDDPSAMGGGGGVVPPSQGRFNDATRVASPMGAGPAQTMMAPRAASPMADAPTMLQRPVEDEFPDPYGAPVPRQGGNQYGGGGWDDQQQPAYGGGAAGAAQQYGGGATGGAQQYGGGQYGEPTQYGRPQDDGYGGGTYGAAAAPAAPAAGGQYAGGTQRYDEPTGMYRPEAEHGGYDEYDQRGGQYGGGAQQYGGGQYGGGGYDQGGYDQGGYGAQPAPAGAYGGGGQYDQGGYDQGGYSEQPGTYGGGQYGGGQYGGAGAAGGQYDQGGYDDQRGGYNEQPNRRGPAQPTHPGQRRTSDWDN